MGLGASAPGSAPSRTRARSSAVRKMQWKPAAMVAAMPLWSHANATYTDQAACASRGPPSCANVGGRDCAPPSGADTTWKLRPNTRVENFPSVRDWTGVASVAACEAKCAATHGCELWTWVDTSPGWSGRGGCWAFPRSAQTCLTVSRSRTWESGRGEDPVMHCRYKYRRTTQS